MTVQYDPENREKVVTKLPAVLRRELKVRAAQLGVDIKDAVTEGIHAWRSQSELLPAVDTTGAEPFATYLPAGLYSDFKADCTARGVAYNQGMAQSIRLWLDTHPAPKGCPVTAGRG